MIKRLVIVAPEFKSEYILHQPWREIYEIATRLQNKGISIAVATSGTNETIVGKINLINLHQEHIRKLTAESKQMIESFSPDVIYWYGNSYSGLYMKNNHFRIPVILHISTVHMLIQELKHLTAKEILNGHILQLTTAFYPFKRIVSSLNNDNITGIISANKTITDRLVYLGVKPSKIHTSPLFFEADIEYPTKSYDRTDIPIICYAGPADSIRGSMIILQAIRILKDRGIDLSLKLLIRSRNPQNEQEYFEEIIRKFRISDKVNVISGILSREEFVSQLVSSDIVVIPTKFVWNEPPLTILEAMHLGRIVVTTNVCGIPETVAGNALTTEPSPEAFAKKIEEIIKNKSMFAELGLQAKTYTDSLPGWDELADWTLSKLEHFRNG